MPLAYRHELTLAVHGVVARVIEGWYRDRGRALGIHGSLEAWPRESPAPRGGPVRISLGPPLDAERVEGTPLDALITTMRREVARLAGPPPADDER